MVAVFKVNKNEKQSNCDTHSMRNCMKNCFCIHSISFDFYEYCFLPKIRRPLFNCNDSFVGLINGGLVQFQIQFSLHNYKYRSKSLWVFLFVPMNGMEWNRTQNRFKFSYYLLFIKQSFVTLNVIFFPIISVIIISLSIHI